MVDPNAAPEKPYHESPCGRWRASTVCYGCYCLFRLIDATKGTWKAASSSGYRPHDIFGLDPDAIFYCWRESDQSWYPSRIDPMFGDLKVVSPNDERF